MSDGLLLGGTLLSLSGLAYLTWSNPKRRRVHGLPLLRRRAFLWPARVAVYAPGLSLIALGHWSGLTIWAGALTTLGWVFAAIGPQTYGRLTTHLLAQINRAVAGSLTLAHQWIDQPARHVSDRLIAWRSHVQSRDSLPRRHAKPAEIDALTQRISTLEARIKQLEGTLIDADRTGSSPTLTTAAATMGKAV